jgi:hypothetical protein
MAQSTPEAFTRVFYVLNSANRFRAAMYNLRHMMVRSERIGC